MDDKEFDEWCANSGINEEGIKIIKKIRSSPPVRKVQGNSSNVIGAYPSTKMGFGIQFESHKVEQAFVIEYEFDDDVLEYYDQPGPIHIEYSSKKGRRVAVYSTPDYFVIRQNGIAGWEECKKEVDLDAFEKKSNRFERIDGAWRSPCSEEYAGRYGLYFRVRSSAEINWVWQQNIEYLSDYLQKESPRCDDKRAQVATTFVMHKQGILLSELLANTDFFSPDDIYALIGQGALYVDLNNEIVSEHDRVHVYTDESHSKLNNQSYLPPQNSFSLEIEPGSTLLWDGRPFTIVNVADKIWIKENDSPPICLTQKELETLVRQNQVKGLKQNTADSYVLMLLQEASPEDYAVANRRLDQIQSYLDNSVKCKKSRTIRGWIKKYREAENTLGYGYVGLLSRIKDRGNRNPKIPERVRELMVTTIDDLFLTIEQRTLIAVYGEFCLRCEDEGLVPASLRTFSEYRRSLDKVETENSRKGPRAAYQLGQFYWSLEYTTPRHGTRPFEVAHLDHQEMDIELLHSKTFKNQGRAWLTLLIDAYSRRVLAFVISYEPPSYRSCMLVMKECVRRHNRLPQTIVVDNGPEFGSIYFEKLLAMYKVTKKSRPPAQPRFGSVLERMFGITNTMFIHTLQGNTQIMKEVRIVTKSVNPANNAIWTLGRLIEQSEKFFFELYDNREHSGLGESPREAFESGMARHGFRAIRLINYDEVFRYSILPTTSKGTCKVINSRGIKIHNIYYWHPSLSSVSGCTVPIKYDPHNISVAYAYIVKNRKWVECSSEYANLLFNLTEKELEVISTQIRREKSLSNKHYLVTARDIAAFMRNSRIMEIELTESKNALEMHEAGVFGDWECVEEVQQYAHPNMSHITEATEIYEELDS